MTRFILVISLCFLSTLCFAQEQLRYHNSEWGFSFVLPQGWKATHEDKLSGEEKKKLKNPLKLSKTVAVCHKINTEHFMTPYIVVRCRGSEEMPESEIEKFFVEDGKMVKKNLEVLIGLLQKVEGCLPNSWKGAKRVSAKVEYDQSRHISFETAMLQHKTVGKIVLATVKLLGSRRMITLRCYYDGQDSENFLELVSQIVDSFAFDEGYGFGESKGVTPGIIQSFIKQSISSWILWTLGAIVLFALIRHWVNN